MAGNLVSIVYSPLAGSYNRKPLSQAVLLAGYGVEHDRKGGHPKRNLNVMDGEILSQLAAEGYPAGPGDLGENLIIQGINLSEQPSGTRVRIGRDAVIELIALREPCYKLTSLDPRMPGSVVGRVGMMARVVEGGVITVGDSVVVV
jgi:MOSC domain-containing protein YiiM